MLKEKLVIQIKQVETLSNLWKSRCCKSILFTNLGNKINELQDSRNWQKFSGTVSRIIRDNLQSDGKIDRAAKYVKVTNLQKIKIDTHI